ncbi:uncharacterized protein LOC133297305 [Gastrolobium bilobum]|uniref:uncharacterized protein LOC133297305 n=1 Tax=Gastrolobium bilobum TaxID=150636 RepID=UPI002AB0D38F|nr:uncharacterized protein LOC133297305 [Gastrolobium bilobum]
MFYSAGLSFTLARNPYFQAAFTFAADNNIGGYMSPSYNSLRTTLLHKEKENIDKLCAPIRAGWKDKGVSIVSDGWSDSQRRPLINFMAVSDAVKNICAAKNVENNQIAYEECSWISDIVGNVSSIKNFIMNHSMRLSMFNEFVGMKLLSIAETRFASMIVMLKRFKLIKCGLQNMMIVKVKKAIYFHELKRMDETSTFYEVVHGILVDRWTKHSTPLHSLAHALNPKYYSEQWLNEYLSRVPPHKDLEINQERQKRLKRYFPNLEDRNKINSEYVDFASMSGGFRDYDAMQNRYSMKPKAWWVLHGACSPMLQKIALQLVAQPSSSSCAEHNWSTYSFVYSVRRNKMTLKRAEDLVYIHSNLRLLSRKTSQYTQGDNRMWDIAGDTFDTFEDVGILEVATLSLDEPEMESNVILDENVP